MLDPGGGASEMILSVITYRYPEKLVFGGPEKSYRPSFLATCVDFALQPAVFKTNILPGVGISSPIRGD